MVNVIKIIAMNASGMSIVAAVIILVVINIPPVKWIWGSGDCKYSNASGTFTFEEINSNGRDYAMAKYKFDEYKKLKSADTVLYRLCPMNVLYVWQYGDYIFSNTYRLPYRSWPEIEQRRGHVVRFTGFQDF